MPNVKTQRAKKKRSAISGTAISKIAISYQGNSFQQTAVSVQQGGDKPRHYRAFGL